MVKVKYDYWFVWVAIMQVILLLAMIFFTDAWFFAGMLATNIIWTIAFFFLFADEIKVKRKNKMEKK